MATEFSQYSQLTGVIVPYFNWNGVTVDYDLTTAQVLASERVPGEAVLKEASVSNPIYQSQASFSVTGTQTVDQEIAVVRGGSPGHGTDGARIAWQTQE